jgi:hypothetical protein
MSARIFSFPLMGLAGLSTICHQACSCRVWESSVIAQILSVRGKYFKVKGFFILSLTCPQPCSILMWIMFKNENAARMGRRFAHGAWVVA